MQKTIFKIQKMDCPSEEQMVRMKLQGFEQIEKLEFDIPKRELKVYHNGQKDQLFSALESLNLDTTLISTEKTEEFLEIEPHGKERKLLWTVLIINVSFFAIEIFTGLIANSICWQTVSFTDLPCLSLVEQLQKKRTLQSLPGIFKSFLLLSDLRK